MFFLRFWAFHGFHFSFNCLLNKLEFLFLSVKLHPDGKGRSFFCGKNTTLPYTQDSIHSEFIFEERNVNRGGKFLIDSGLDQMIEQFVSLSSVNRGDVFANGDQIVPEGRSFHKAIVTVFFLSEFIDDSWRLRWRIGVPYTTIREFVEIIFALGDAFLDVEGGKNGEIFLLGHHTFGELDTRESIFAVDGHFG